MEINNRTHRRTRRSVSEINVVPYIDVMLVLLIIFMTTAPILTEGVNVNLPKANAKVVENPEEIEKVIVSVDEQGQFFINDEKSPSTIQAIRAKARVLYNQTPDIPFYVKGDEAVQYNSVMQAMVALQQAGVSTVGLVTKPSGELINEDLDIDDVRNIQMSPQ